MLDSTPQSPNPNLTRTGSSISTPERSGSPMKGLPFPGSAPTPAHAETSTVSATGENGLWDDDDRQDLTSRARRELSVIDESSSIAPKDEADALQEPLEEEPGSDAGEGTGEDKGTEDVTVEPPPDDPAEHVAEDTVEDKRSEGRIPSVAPEEEVGTNPAIVITT